MMTLKQITKEIWAAHRAYEILVKQGKEEAAKKELARIERLREVARGINR